MDSLWGVAVSELTDWETMTSLLLHENGEEQGVSLQVQMFYLHVCQMWRITKCFCACLPVLGLNDDEEAALIEQMMCAVRQATEGTPPTARALGKKVEGGREPDIDIGNWLMYRVTNQCAMSVLEFKRPKTTKSGEETHHQSFHTTSASVTH